MGWELERGYLDDHVQRGVLVEEILQGVVLAPAGALADADDALEGEVERCAERHAQEVGRREDA